MRLISWTLQSGSKQLQYSNNFNYIFTIIDRTSKYKEAVSLSDTSAAAFPEALTFSWISRFGVPKTITSDHGLQFTLNLRFKLCKMLDTSHQQTTTYHPESNKAVERLYSRLKDTFRAHRRGDLVRGVTFCAPRTPGTAEGRHWCFPS